MNVEHQSTLPAGLAGVLNRPDEHRDSAYYSSVDPSSKHTSTQSANGHNVLTPPSNYHSATGPDNTPSPINTSMLNQPLPSPASMSVASMVSPTTDQTMLRRLDRQSYESGSMSAGLGNFDVDSRRQSVNSQLGQGLVDLKLANSPYASNNQSTTSIQSTLQHQRNPGGAERNSLGRMYSSGTPSQRTSIPSYPEPVISPRGPRAPIIAPAITGPAQGNIARAPEAIPGQAWAFPEEPIQQLNSRARPSAESINRAGTSFFDESRRSSISESVASSQFTTESRLPVGQRRFEENIPSQEYQRLSRASSELQNVQTHHHSLQHKQVSDLQSDAGSPGGSQPYSRTPELRVSHKLAERKRRTEMKDLFDNLRDLMPQERGSKASKWEILTKAINEYKQLKDALDKERAKCASISKDRDILARENASLRNENSQYRERMGGMSGHRGEHIGREHEHLMDTNHSHYQAAPIRLPQSEQLPPLRIPPAPDSMNGIQYQSGPRVNGYPRF